MLVGTIDIDMNELAKKCKSVNQLKAYSDELVPVYFRHVKEIVDNQRYLTAVCVRNILQDDYNKWKPLCTGLLEGVRITGSVTDLYSCDDLLRSCNVPLIKKFLEKEMSK